MAQVNSENSTAMPASDAGALYFPTDVTPEELFQAIGRLRKDVRDEVERLIQFLDKTDDYVSRELEDDDDREDVGDDEPSLGSFDRMADQSRAWGQHRLWDPPEVDAEQDDAETEPSLGSVGEANQERWAAGDRRDLELDGAESGIGDLDGLLEQIGTNDWTAGRGGMV